MRNSTCEHLRGIARKHGVGVEGYDIPDSPKRRRVPDDRGERISCLSPQESVELAEFATFTLPSHPHALFGIPQPWTMEEVENVGTIGRILEVQEARS